VPDVYVTGLREVIRDFNRMGGEVKEKTRAALVKVGDPVKETAEQLAAGSIRNLGGFWGQMRVGVTSQSVYVALAARRRGGSPRPNLGRLLMNDALLPAVDQNEPRIRRELEDMLDDLTRGF
jgi:hypothetical protein